MVSALVLPGHNAKDFKHTQNIDTGILEIDLIHQMGQPKQHF